MRSAREVKIPTEGGALEGTLVVPEGATGLVLFAHGSGSSRHSSRNRQVAQVLQGAGLGTLLFDLLTPEEEVEERHTHHLRFDIGLLAERLGAATRWVARQPQTSGLSLGVFGSSTGAAAALVAAARAPERIQAVVSRGGRPDLAVDALSSVRAPTLLLVGGADREVLHLNREAYLRLRTEKQLEVIPYATHLFEEPGALEQVAAEASRWFVQHLGTASWTTPSSGSPSHD